MNPFISHPSVRIKGTENNYEPATCIDTGCQKTWPHMHCPFCVKSEIFQDPVILKAHYRVKHVDKGIEFAGLKILRCCERCDIVGTIKGTKELKGAHWHCYRCKNGFTRRDEAIKHYRTHFRNPSTTFQIQVAQDINQSVDVHMKDVGGGSQEMAMIETVISSGGSRVDALVAFQPCSPREGTQAECQDGEKSQSSEIQVSVAANETVDGCDGHAYMIIHDEDNMGQAEVIATMEPLPISITQAVPQLASPVQKVPEPPVKEVPARVTGHWRQEKCFLEAQLRDIKAENTRLIEEKKHAQIELNTEVENLKVQLQMANAEITAYQKREVDLLNQLKVPLDDRITEILTDLKSQHEELLHHQLAQLRRTYINQLQEELGVSHKSPSQAGDGVEMTMVQSSPLTPVMATVTGSNNMVLTTGGYTTLAAGNLTTGNIMLTSEGLMADGSATAPIFVVAHNQLSQVKAELKDDLAADQSAMIDGSLQTSIMGSSHQTALIDSSNQTTIISDSNPTALIDGDDQNIMIDGASQNAMMDNTDQNTMMDNTVQSAMMDNVDHNCVIDNTNQPSMIDNADQHTIINSANQTVLIDNALLEADDPTAASLEDYPGVDQEVVPSNGENLEEKILLTTTVVNDSVTSDMDLTSKTLALSVQSGHLSCKRKLDSESDNNLRTKQLKDNND